MLRSGTLECKLARLLSLGTNEDIPSPIVGYLYIFLGSNFKFSLCFELVISTDKAISSGCIYSFSVLIQGRESVFLLLKCRNLSN